MDGYPAKFLTFEYPSKWGPQVCSTLVIKRKNVFCEVFFMHYKEYEAYYAKRSKNAFDSVHFLTKRQLEALPASMRSK